ncbi:hypothetical protein [Candidatus Clostridium radicumherbarum]|uniref:DUF4412 domain-containing protein n=1 Tax=Candidatus Clostridium radicumherbarum TaxID=3381662 RepID=A0ABW8TVF4_9CLOT
MKISFKSIMIGIGISIIISGVYLYSNFNNKVNNKNVNKLTTNKFEDKSLKLQILDKDTKINLSANGVTYTCDYENLPSGSDYTTDAPHEGFIYLRDLEIFLSRLEEGTNQSIREGINSGKSISYSWTDSLSWTATPNNEVDNWQLNLDLFLNKVPQGKGIHIKRDAVSWKEDEGIYIPIKYLSDLGLPIEKIE